MVDDKLGTDEDALLKKALAEAKEYSLELQEREEARLRQKIEFPLTLGKALRGLTKTELDICAKLGDFPV